MGTMAPVVRLAVGVGLAGEARGGQIPLELAQAFAGPELLLPLASAIAFGILAFVTRSALLPVVVLVSAGLGVAVAATTSFGLDRAGVIRLDGQSEAVLVSLVVGAGAGYSLLVAGRCGEELRHRERPVEAVRAAVRRSARPLLASGLTVILAALCLVTSGMPTTRASGVVVGLALVAALGIAAALLVALTFLPGALALLGRLAYWPRRLAVDGEPPGAGGRVWAVLAALIVRRTKAVWVLTFAVLIVLVGFVPAFRASRALPPGGFVRTVPLVLVVLLGVLALTLRALVAPLVLVFAAVLSGGATIGVAALVFRDVLRFPGADPVVPLVGFVLLVGLNSGYAVLLMARVRAEVPALGARAAMLEGLRMTGGVIAAAGVVLAGSFAALAVVPTVFLAQLAFIVAFGVLLDTFVVRPLLVAALAFVAGRWMWWPGRLCREGYGGH
ncbi:MMPL family transporter [Actinopolymorpha alba]|uniref:MMPL family transporter n=1 Tax=Actinopolymorpha alba TaxID=533267 RepID=UPI00036630AC|nr:MMPL family transporter [Actinopolymorpha alba]